MQRIPIPYLSLFAVVAISCGDGNGGATEPDVEVGSVQVLLTMTGDDLDPGCARDRSRHGDAGRDGHGCEGARQSAPGRTR